MEDLGKRLPEIAKKVLQEEDEITRILAYRLLEEVRSRPSLTKQQMISVMDDEIYKCIDSKMVEISDFQIKEEKYGI